MVSADRQSTEKSMKHLLLAAIVLGVAFCFGKSTGIWWLIVTVGKIILFVLATSIFIGAAVVLYIAYLICNLRFSGSSHSTRSSNQYSRGIASLLSWFCSPSRNMGGYENGRRVYSWFGKGIDTMMGNMFDPRKTVGIWNEKKLVVGREAVLRLQLYKKNLLSYDASKFHALESKVTINNEEITSSVQISKGSTTSVDVYFTPIIAGTYVIAVSSNNSLITNGSIAQEFKSGPVDATKSCLAVPSSILLLVQGVEESITLEEQDKYGNKCLSSFEELYKYEFTITQLNGAQITPTLSFSSGHAGNIARKNEAWLRIEKAGIYKVLVTHDSVTINNDLVLLVLTEEELEEINKNVRTCNWNLFYEAYVYTKRKRKNSALPSDRVTMEDTHDQENNSYSSPDMLKKKTVYCYIGPKWLQIKEYYLKIIPKTLYSIRINNALQTSFSNEDENGVRGLNVVSGSKNITLYTDSLNILLGTLVKLLLKNIGGSENFEKKRKYFHGELQKLKPAMLLPTSSIDVRRIHIVNDTLQKTKSFSSTDWWRKFDIHFIGEHGIDGGGLTREWMNQVLNELFHSKGALFRKFNDQDSQGLIHPNHYRDEKYKRVQLFKLAGHLIGKCLIEASFSTKRQLYAKARFTRAFLSQILGFGVNWKHFAMDDKEFYTGKIKYVLENDPRELEIYFTDDVFDNNNKFIKTVDLKPGGSRTEVTNANKLEYVQKLAEWRLSESVKEEVNQFLKGLYSLVPERLLSIFNVSELELLICGMGNISVTDMKNNSEIEGRFFDTQTLPWFWSVISSFNQEELSRLLQFTTGCSQLPPEGFAGLNPKFKISRNWSIDVLPMASTCFNNLHLPKYSSIDELRSKLLLAINDFSEEFGLS